MSNFMSQISSIELEPFVSATVEVYPNKDHTGGHAITLIYGVSDKDPKNEMFYMIDDQRSFSPLHIYYTNRNERMYELSLRDVTDVTVANINDVLHKQASINNGCKFSKRVTRYSLCFEDNFLSPTDELIKTEFRNKATEIADLHVQQPDHEPKHIVSLPPPKPNKPSYQPIEAYKPFYSIASKEKLIGFIMLGFIVGLVVGVLVTLTVINKNKSHTLTKRQPISDR